MNIIIYKPDEQLPFRVVLPRLVWNAFRSIALATVRLKITGTAITDEDAKTLSNMIGSQWEDLPYWFGLAVGIENESESKVLAVEWLLSDGWQQRVRWLQAFFRAGGFSVEEDRDLVVLRTDP